MSRTDLAEKQLQRLVDSLVNHIAEAALIELAVYGVVVLRDGKVIPRNEWYNHESGAKADNPP